MKRRASTLNEMKGPALLGGMGFKVDPSLRSGLTAGTLQDDGFLACGDEGLAALFLLSYIT